MTVLFADLSGSTALGEQLDPEDVRGLQSELFSVLHTEVERFGGTTEMFVGDAILADFGIPQTHEDDPERAVRAALAAHERFAAFAEHVRDSYQAEVGLRIGVNTGDVVASREGAARGELMVSGDTVNVAARLQQGAKPGEVLVGERTHTATSRTVAYGARRDVDAKGKQSVVPAWVALSALVEPALRPTGLTGPFIGRAQEVAVLDAVAERVASERVPQLVTLFGPAGVGKSRLLGELLARLPESKDDEGTLPCAYMAKGSRTGRSQKRRRRKPGSSTPIPSIRHWKSFASRSRPLSANERPMSSRRLRGPSASR